MKKQNNKGIAPLKDWGEEPERGQIKLQSNQADCFMDQKLHTYVCAWSFIEGQSDVRGRQQFDDLEAHQW